MQQFVVLVIHWAILFLRNLICDEFGKLSHCEIYDFLRSCLFLLSAARRINSRVLVHSAKPWILVSSEALPSRISAAGRVSKQENVYSRGTCSGLVISNESISASAQEPRFVSKFRCRTSGFKYRWAHKSSEPSWKSQAHSVSWISSPSKDFSNLSQVSNFLRFYSTFKSSGTLSYSAVLLWPVLLLLVFCNKYCAMDLS